MKQVTVVIPNYNGMKYLPECLKSLSKDYQQAKVDYEVLVVDNGSTDGSVEFLEKLPYVKSIFLDTNTGFCHAVNVGIKEASTPYVLLLNNDTKAYPGFVGGLYKAIAHRKKCFSVSAKMLMWDDPTLLDDAGDLYSVLGYSRARGKGKPEVNYNKAVRVFSACGGAAIYQRAVFEEIGLFDELHFAYLEDLDIGYRAKLYGYYNLYEPSAKVLHYGSASTGSRYNPKKTELSSANNIYVISKNMPWPQIVLNICPLFIGFAVKAVFFARKGMGRLYLAGLLTGFRRANSYEGRKMRVPMRARHFWNCVKIQWELWVNVLRSIMD